MHPLHHAAAGAAESHSSSTTRIRLGGWATLLLAATMAVPAFADTGNFRQTAAAAQHQPIHGEQANMLADMEFEDSERERAAIAALGFNPDDPLVVAAYREETSADSPYTPFDANSYVADPAFNSGKYIENDFGGSISSPQGYFLGRKVARLDNGDIVVAAMIKNPGGNQTNGFWNLGLAKYSAAGSRKCWTSPGAYGGGQGDCIYSSATPWIVYPKSDTAYISWVQDIKVIDDFILVSVNRNFNGTTDIDTHVYVFNTAGKYLSTAEVFNSGNYNEMIGGMEVYHTGFAPEITHVVVTATQFWRDGSQKPKPIFRRYTLSSNGFMTAATGTVVLNYSSNCDDTSESCEAKGIALGEPALVGASIHPAIFIAVARKKTADYDVMVLRVNQDGVADPSWQTGWMDAGGIAKDDVPFGIAVNSYNGLPGSPRVHTVYVASNSARECKGGISVVRVSTDYNNGGSYSRTVFGGSSAPIGTLCSFGSTDYGNGLTMQAGKLAIVGMRVWSPPCPIGGTCPEDSVDSTFALLDNLTVKSFETYAFDIGASRSKHSGMYGVVGTGDGKFVMTGDSRYTSDAVLPSWRGKQKVALLGLAPPVDDTIFENGFD
ncbi:MAG: hypothetical protein KIS89_00875 [Dokdonella sp.]|nr:hypothetical protein [Dokdonella sp.]